MATYMTTTDTPSKTAIQATAAQVVTTDWRRTLPVLTAPALTLRELRLSDAPSLLAMLATEEVARFISPPPTTVDGFEKSSDVGRLAVVGQLGTRVELSADAFLRDAESRFL